MKSKRTNWDQIFHRRAESKLSDAAFCRQENISSSAFYKQKKGRGLSRPYERAATVKTDMVKPDLVELTLEGSNLPHVNPTIRLTNPNGITIEVYL